ncbi:hypothetical protein D3C73_849590 [compost metagenome]
MAPVKVMVCAPPFKQTTAVPLMVAVAVDVTVSLKVLVSVFTPPKSVPPLSVTVTEILATSLTLFFK